MLNKSQAFAETFTRSKVGGGKSNAPAEQGAQLGTGGPAGSPGKLHSLKPNSFWLANISFTFQRRTFIIVYLVGITLLNKISPI